MKKKPDVLNIEKEKIKELITKGLSNRAIARELSGSNDNSDFWRIRSKVARIKNKSTFEKTLKDNNLLPTNNWEYGWVKTKENSIFVRNPENQFNLQELITECLSIIPKAEKKEISVEKNQTFDRLIITDVHIGLDTNKSGVALYGTEWNKEKLFFDLSEIDKIEIKSNEIYIDCLGDFLDGYDGLTTRGGHSLEQNMSTKEQFKNGVEFFLQLCNFISKKYQKVTINFLTNDNHGGSFAEIFGYTIEKLLPLHFSNINVNIQNEFINYYDVGNHTFILCHGKDKKFMKYGFSATPTKDNIQKVENYIFQKRINLDRFIEFSKGDSHLYISSNGSSDIFDYVSYPTFAPNSEYVTTNFKKGKRGFVFQTIDYEKNIKTITPYYLD